jgi:hypothetical protein
LINAPISQIGCLNFLTGFGMASIQNNLIPILLHLVPESLDSLLTPVMAQRFL